MATERDAPLDLRGYTMAVLGGDGREVEIARQALFCGASVRVCGLPPVDVEGITVCSDIRDAVFGADIVVCPVPLPEADGSIYAPYAPSKLVVDRNTLEGMRMGGILITGRASAQMREAATALDLKLHEYEHVEDLMLLRAPAVAEGAIRLAIEHTAVTLHGNSVMVVGYGNIGSVLAGMLRGLGARVTVAARNPVQRARAWALGCDTVPIQEMTERIPNMVVVFNTAPALLFTSDVLCHFGPETLLIDLSAPPGGVDFRAADELGVKTIWARGLGGRAPRTVGQIQWIGIKRILESELLQREGLTGGTGSVA
mgnify:FL=1